MRLFCRIAMETLTSGTVSAMIKFIVASEGVTRWQIETGRLIGKVGK